MALLVNAARLPVCPVSFKPVGYFYPPAGWGIKLGNL